MTFFSFPFPCLICSYLSFPSFRCFYLSFPSRSFPYLFLSYLNLSFPSLSFPCLFLSSLSFFTLHCFLNLCLPIPYFTCSCLSFRPPPSNGVIYLSPPIPFPTYSYLNFLLLTCIAGEHNPAMRGAAGVGSCHAPAMHSTHLHTARPRRGLRKGEETLIMAPVHDCN